LCCSASFREQVDSSLLTISINQARPQVLIRPYFEIFRFFGSPAARRSGEKKNGRRGEAGGEPTDLFQAPKPPGAESCSYLSSSEEWTS
jgi:hypothetical protein